MTGLLPPQTSFAPDASWTKNLPAEKRLNCIDVAQEAFRQAEQKLREIDRRGIDRERVRVAALMPRLPHAEVDRGCRRYASFMSKNFREHGLDFRVEEALSADALELLIMGAQANDRIHGTFIFFPTPFERTEDYFLRRVRPEKDIEGLTIENTGRMALNIKTFDEEQKYEGVVPCTARAILAAASQPLHQGHVSERPRPNGAGGCHPEQFSADRYSAAEHVDAHRRYNHDRSLANAAGGPRSLLGKRGYCGNGFSGALGSGSDPPGQKGRRSDRLLHGWKPASRSHGARGPRLNL